ncbi:MAG TPA: hypothetical protein PKE05_02545 [Microthrixaceae bacterium]|nr:hypothetical protein [Microthrixaceae bacterium]
MTVGDDVLDRLVVEQRLKSPEVEEPIEDGASELILFVLRQHGASGGDGRGGKTLKVLADQLASQHLLVGGVEVAAVGSEPPHRRRELFRNLDPHRADECLVEHEQVAHEATAEC